MWDAKPDPELCSCSGCCCPSCSSGGKSRDGALAGLALSTHGGGSFTGLRLAGLGGTGLLGLGGTLDGGAFHGRFFLGSRAGGRGSGLWGVSGTAAPFARFGTGTELARLRALDEILFETVVSLPLVDLAATAGAVSAEGALLLDLAAGEPAGSHAVSVATRAVSATPAAALCADCLQG